jgi:hypothetical protein
MSGVSDALPPVKIEQLEATVHILNAKFALERMRVAEARADVETLTFWLRDAERRIESLRRHRVIEHWRRFWSRLRPGAPALLDNGGRSQPNSIQVEAARVRYFLRNSPFRVYREATFTLEGWALPEDGARVTGLRARVDSEVFFGTYGVEEPPVPEWHHQQANNPLPGFKIIIDVPSGRHQLSLEVQLNGHSRWYSFLTLPIWSVIGDRKAA